MLDSILSALYILLNLRLANFLCKEPESKHFKLCGPYSLSQLLNSVVVALK